MGSKTLPNYRLTFETIDGGYEDYFYHTIEQAKEHMSYFDESDADIYRRIYIANHETGETLVDTRF